jgi:predicted transcriptional regulator
MPTPTTTVRLPPHLRQRLQRYAKARNQTNTGVIIQALRAFFEQKEAAEHKYQVRQELARLAEIDRADPELEGFFGEPETDPFGEES